MFERPKTV